jgi:hypothetical protein
MRHEIPDCHHGSANEARCAFASARIRLPRRIEFREVKPRNVAAGSEQLGKVLPDDRWASKGLKVAFKCLTCGLHRLSVVRTVEEARRTLPNRWVKIRRRQLWTRWTEDRRHTCLLGQPRSKNYQTLPVLLVGVRGVHPFVRRVSDRDFGSINMLCDLTYEFKFRDDDRMLELKRLIPSFTEDEAFAVVGATVEEVKLVDSNDGFIDDANGGRNIHSAIVHDALGRSADLPAGAHLWRPYSHVTIKKSAVRTQSLRDSDIDPGTCNPSRSWRMARLFVGSGLLIVIVSRVAASVTTVRHLAPDVPDPIGSSNHGPRILPRVRPPLGAAPHK